MLPGVRSPTWQQLGLEAPKRRVIPFCPKCELVEKVRRKIRDPLSKTGRHHRKKEQQYAQCLGGDTSLCLSTSSDELHGAENDSGGHGGAELCPQCSQRATLGPPHVRQQGVEQKASSWSKLSSRLVQEALQRKASESR